MGSYPPQFAKLRMSTPMMSRLLSLAGLLLILTAPGKCTSPGMSTGAGKIDTVSRLSASDGTKLAVGTDPPGCTLAATGAWPRAGHCPAEGGFAVSECGNKKIQAQFDVTGVDCANKTTAVLDACQQQAANNQALGEDCKVATMQFKLVAETAWSNWSQNNNAAGVWANNNCAAKVAYIANDWYLTAANLANQVAQELCNPATKRRSGRKLMQLGRTPSPSPSLTPPMSQDRIDTS